MARLTFKKCFECFRSDEKTTTICVNGYTQICEPIFSPDSIHPQFQNCYLVGEAVDKLASYEDAEEQGLLQRTPVAIGQTVYTNFAMRGWYLRDKDRPYKAKVVFIGLNDSKEDGGGFFNISYEKLGCMMQFRFSDIGKGVFLAKEEAQTMRDYYDAWKSEGE